jgi:hypothetical protein
MDACETCEHKRDLGDQIPYRRTSNRGPRRIQDCGLEGWLVPYVGQHDLVEPQSNGVVVSGATVNDTIHGNVQVAYVVKGAGSRLFHTDPYALQILNPIQLMFGRSSSYRL